MNLPLLERILPVKFRFTMLKGRANYLCTRRLHKAVQQAQSHGIEMYLCPNLGVQDGIQAARITLPRCDFDQDKCAEGLEALGQYQREWDEDKKRFKDKPRHDWTSHAADAFRYLSLVWKEPPPEKARPEPTKCLMVGNNKVTLNELLKANDRKQERRRRI